MPLPCLLQGPEGVFKRFQPFVHRTSFQEMNLLGSVQKYLLQHTIVFSGEEHETWSCTTSGEKSKFFAPSLWKGKLTNSLAHLKINNCEEWWNPLTRPSVVTALFQKGRFQFLQTWSRLWLFGIVVSSMSWMRAPGFQSSWECSRLLIFNRGPFSRWVLWGGQLHEHWVFQYRSIPK